LKAPGFYFSVGGTPQSIRCGHGWRPACCGHHSGLFKIDLKASIVTGATAMTVAVMELLAKK